MTRKLSITVGTIVLAVALGAAGLFAFSAFADSADVAFESPTYALGNINGQDGWTKTGGYDVAVTSSYGVPGFGSQSLRFSNAVTSGSFGDQTFSKHLVDEAGESDAQSTSFGGTRQPHFEAEFEIRPMTLVEQPGLFLSVSPDSGDGARMSYLSFADTPDGIDVTFYDVTSVIDPATFSPTLIADNLSRAVTHKFKFVIDFVDGPSNDVVKIYHNDVLVHTGTTWENYYRFDNESNPNLVNQSRVVRALLFRAGGAAAPATAGMGYLIDNVNLSSSGATAVTEDTIVVRAADLDPNGPLPGDVYAGGLDKWFFYNDENDTVDNGLGSFVAGPDTTPLGDGSAQISVTGSERRNLATYQFGGTPLSSIREMRFSTYNPSAGNGGSADRSAYLNFNVDFNGTDTWQRRLVFLPSDNGTVVQDTWQEWDAVQDGAAMYRYSGATWPGTATAGTTPRSWNDLLASYPGIRMRVTDSWLGLRVGEPYVDGYTENIDKFVFETNSTRKVFDFEPAAATPDVTVTIVKYVDGVHATAVNADNASFPMNASWAATNIGAGSGSFNLSTTGFNNPNEYEATTADMTSGADYSVAEDLTGSNVGASCVEGKPFALTGYSVGSSELAAAGAATSSSAVLTGITSDTYIIVWNETCAPAPATGTLTLQKIVNNNDTGTEIDTAWTLSANGPTPISGVEGNANVTNAVVTPGVYDLSESGPSGYTGSAWVCTGAALQNDGDTVTVAAGENVTCTITNDDNAAPPVVPPPANACSTPGVAPLGYTLQNGTVGNDDVTIVPFTMFVGHGGYDIVNGPADGNYIVCTGAKTDKITLGNGDFTISAGDGYNVIVTGNGSGYIVGGVDADNITTGDGVQTIHAGDGYNKIVTGNGNKNITAGVKGDQITTGSGNDVIDAGGGHNNIKSGAGNDSITAGTGNDTIDGGADTDTCSAGIGYNSVINCEA